MKLKYINPLIVQVLVKGGGSVFTPYAKKDLKPFIVRVKYAIDMTNKVVDKVAIRYPISFN